MRKMCAERLTVLPAALDLQSLQRKMQSCNQMSDAPELEDTAASVLGSPKSQSKDSMQVSPTKQGSGRSQLPAAPLPRKPDSPRKWSLPAPVKEAERNLQGRKGRALVQVWFLPGAGWRWPDPQTARSLCSENWECLEPRVGPSKDKLVCSAAGAIYMYLLKLV